MQRNLTGKALEEFKNDSDWQHAFYEAVYSTCGFNYMDQEDRGPIEYVEEVISCEVGENDGDEWIAIVCLKMPELPGGKFAIMAAGCDYTGWDCHASGVIEYYNTLGEAITELTPEQAHRLHYPHDATRYKLKSLAEQVENIPDNNDAKFRDIAREIIELCNVKDMPYTYQGEEFYSAEDVIVNIVKKYLGVI